MAEITFEELDVPVPNRFVRGAEHRALALMLPGMRYTCDKPLLYHATQVLLAHGADVVQSWAEYTQPAFAQSSPAERLARLVADARALLDAALATGVYRRLVLVGKSLGTLTMSGLLTQSTWPAPPLSVWLTPLVKYPPVIQAAQALPAPALYVASRQDPTFDADGWSAVLAAPQAEGLLFDEGNHSLELPGQPLRSLDLLRAFVERLHTFLEQQWA